MLPLDWGGRRRRAGLPSGVVPAEVLRLAVIAIPTHLILDILNVYGVRWHALPHWWFYGDTLFIVDPWLGSTGAGRPDRPSPEGGRARRWTGPVRVALEWRPRM
jgi:hypothetical protein